MTKGRRPWPAPLAFFQRKGFAPRIVESRCKAKGRGAPAVRIRTGWLLGLALAMVLAVVPSRALADPEPPAAASGPTADEKTILAELFTLGRKLDETKATLAQLDGQIADAAHAQEAAQTERDRLEVQRKARMTQYGRRLRYYNEQGSMAPMAFLLGSRTLGEFLQRAEVVNEMLKRDAALLRELRALKAGVEAQEREAAAARERLTALKTQLQQQETQLTRDIAAREAILAGLKDQRGAMEARLNDLEQAWEQKAKPVLEALGTALRGVDPAEFQPDSLSVSFFPPGATAHISEQNLNQFLGKHGDLRGLAFHLRGGEASLDGDFNGAAIRIAGKFSVAGKTVLRFEPTAIRIRDFDVPPAAIARLLTAGTIDIDVGAMIKPWSLQSIQVADGDLAIKAGFH